MNPGRCVASTEPEPTGVLGKSISITVLQEICIENGFLRPRSLGTDSKYGALRGKPIRCRQSGTMLSLVGMPLHERPRHRWRRLHGSHACLGLIEAGHRVTIADNLDRGNPGAVRELESLAASFGSSAATSSAERLVELMQDARIDSVLHFAALAYVGESVDEPFATTGTTPPVGSPPRGCARTGVERFIFSSTCATYGEPAPERIPSRRTARNSR